MNMIDLPMIAQGTMPEDQGFWPLVGAVLFAAALFGIVLTALKCYKRCPSNKILVKWGAGSGKQAAKCVQGGGELVFPIFQDYDFLSLEPIQIEIPCAGPCRSRTSGSTCRASSPWRSARTRRCSRTRRSGCSGCLGSR